MVSFGKIDWEKVRERYQRYATILKHLIFQLNITHYTCTCIYVQFYYKTRDNPDKVTFKIVQ